jgi:hypothetical protein
MTEKPRTLTQNKAIHLYFNHLSDELNNAGLDVQRTLTHDVEIPWNPYLVKELIWKRILMAQLGKDSTTKMTTKEIDMVFETITRYLATNFGLSVDFPSIESLMMKERLK